MNRRISLALATLIVPARAIAAPVMDQSADPYPGVHRERWTDAAVPAHIHLVRVDLSRSEISIVATAETDKGITPSTFATRAGAQLAINGDFYAAASYLPRGLAVGDATPWGQTADDDRSGLIQLDRGVDRAVVSIIPPEVVVAAASLPPENEGVVGGRPLLVRAGVVQAPACDDPETLACVRAPRTAVGLTADGNTLLLVVVDGWQAGSIGLTANELAGFLVARGARDVLGLGVGASSAMVLDGALVSSPSDGVERAVANHLAVRYGALPAGELVGLICLDTIFDCQTKIAGAVVTLDDGRTDTTGASGIYDFLGVPPRYACVDVAAAGYEPAHKCQQVTSRMETYNSVALYPIGEAPDAGPRPDGGFAATPDAGIDGQPPGGCCDAGAAGPGGVMIAAAIVALSLSRRRRRAA